MKVESDEKKWVSAGLFGRWRASLRWAGRSPVGPGEECEGNERINFLTLSGVSPCGKGLSVGGGPRLEVLVGEGCRD